MLHPSYKEMIEKINDTKSEGDAEMHSRYSLVIAAAKRARQINSGSEPLVEVNGKEKNLSTAVNELFAGKVHIMDNSAVISDEPGDYEDELPAEEAEEEFGEAEAAEEEPAEDLPDPDDAE